MHLGRPAEERSRREQRREKEQAFGPDPDVAAMEKRRIVPAVLAGVRPPSEVPLPPNEVETKSAAQRLPPPSQEEIKKRVLQARQPTEIIFQEDYFKEDRETRRTIIEDVDQKGRIYLAQTMPLVLRSHKGKELRVSFAAKFYDLPGGRWLRVGYKGRIIDVVPGYQMSDGAKEPVIVVSAPARLDPDSIRTSFRITPPEDLDLRLELWPDRQQVGLMDLSAGGLRFYHHRAWFFPKGKVVSLRLRSGVHAVILQGKVVRGGKIQDIYGAYRGWTSVRFWEVDPENKDHYLQLLSGVYRHLLAQRSGLDRGRIGR